MRRLLPLSLTLLPLWLALLASCNVVNTRHCGNLEGDATCSQRAATSPYCDICVADNDGCVATRPTDPACLATTSALPSTSSSTVDPTTTTTTTTVDPTTTTTTPTTTTGTTDASTTGAPDTSTSTTSSTSTSTTDATATSGTTIVDPMCGNDMVEGDEVCDGADLDGMKCIDIAQGKYGGGTLACTESCQSFDDTKCCLGVGIKCGAFGPKCCGGLSCSWLGTCKVD